MREGQKTLGVWLPLALADIVKLLVIVSRRAAGDVSEIKEVETSEILRGWALPMTAAAAAEDEEERKAFELLNSVRNLGKGK